MTSSAPTRVHTHATGDAVTPDWVTKPSISSASAASAATQRQEMFAPANKDVRVRNDNTSGKHSTTAVRTSPMMMVASADDESDFIKEESNKKAQHQLQTSLSLPVGTAHSTSARNLPWQKHFKLRVASVCTKIIDEPPALLERMIAALDKRTGHGTFELMPDIKVMGVLDANRPPRDLEYDVVTIAVQCPPSSSFFSASPSSTTGDRRAGTARGTGENDGHHLVREISSFQLAPGRPSITERLFMDKHRPLYKAKGWGIGTWRVWLALEDVDALRKKRKKTPQPALDAAASPPPTPTGGDDLGLLQRRESYVSEAGSSDSGASKRMRMEEVASPGTPFGGLIDRSGALATTAAMYNPSGKSPVLMNPLNMNPLLLHRQVSLPSILGPQPVLTRTASNGYVFPSIHAAMPLQQQPNYILHHPVSSAGAALLAPPAPPPPMSPMGWHHQPVTPLGAATSHQATMLLGSHQHLLAGMNVLSQGNSRTPNSATMPTMPTMPARMWPNGGGEFPRQ